MSSVTIMSQLCEHCGIELGEYIMLLLSFIYYFYISGEFSRQWIWAHAKLHETDREKCDQCGQSYKNLIMLKKHQDKVHVNNFHECSECKKMFKDRYKLNEHVATIHENLKYTCGICSKEFPWKKNLDVHVKNILFCF